MYDLDWTAVARASFSLDSQWKPAQWASWLNDFMRHVHKIMIGSIPVAGPLLAVLFRGMDNGCEPRLGI